MENGKNVNGNKKKKIGKYNILNGIKIKKIKNKKLKEINCKFINDNCDENEKKKNYDIINLIDENDSNDDIKVNGCEGRKKNKRKVKRKIIFDDDSEYSDGDNDLVYKK